MQRRLFLGSVSCLSVPGALARPIAASPGVGVDEILLGQTSDFSASRSAVTRGYAEGTRLVFEAINESGGVHGRRLRVAQVDDAYSVPKALANARDLVEQQRVFALVHCLGTAIVEQLIPYAEDQAVPNIHPLTGADHIRAPELVSRQTFFLRASYRQEIERIVGQLKAIGVSRIALVHEAEPFGESIRRMVAGAMGAARMQLAAIGVSPFNQPDDVGAAVAAVAKAKPTAIIMGSAGPSVENFIRSYQATGQRAQYYCLSVSNVERLHKALGKLGEGIVVSQVMPSVAGNRFPIVAEYRRAMESAGLSPASFGLEGYISARMIVAALRSAGPVLTREKFVAALADPKLAQIGGFPVKYRAEPRNGSPFVELAMIGAGGKLVQ